MTRWYGWFATGLLLFLAGCASSPVGDYGWASPHPPPDRVELVNTPFYPQEEDQCGPAALATILGSAGVTRSPQTLKDEVYLPQRHGSLQPEMLAAVRRAGLLAYPLEPEPDVLLQEVAAGHPVVVLQNLRFKLFPQWHYAVVAGYDRGQGKIILRSGGEKRLLMSFADFDQSWQKAGRWAFVALPPDQLPATVNQSDFLIAAAALEHSSPLAAGRAYQAALKAWPGNLIARIGSGNVAYVLHQLQAARAAYQQATIEHPEAADAWNNLAQVQYEMGLRAEALNAATHAVTLGGPRLTTYESTLLMIETDHPG